MTSKLVNDILTATEQVAPTAPIVQVAAAAIATASDPSASNILADVELLITLVRRLRSVAPTLLAEVKALL